MYVLYMKKPISLKISFLCGMDETLTIFSHLQHIIFHHLNARRDAENMRRF